MSIILRRIMGRRGSRRVLLRKGVDFWGLMLCWLVEMFCLLALPRRLGWLWTGLGIGLSKLSNISCFEVL